MVEAIPQNFDNPNEAEQVKETNSPLGNYLNIETARYKKQKTLSANRKKEGSKSKIDKSSIKKSETRTSKWSQYLKSTQKGGKRSPARSKTIERKFTLSSSISSIQCLSKNRKNEKSKPKVSFLKKKPTQNLSVSSRKGVNRKERFQGLKLNVPQLRKTAKSSLFKVVSKGTKSKHKMESFNSEIDPSLERSLEKARQFDAIPSRKILAYRYRIFDYYSFVYFL